MIVNFEIRGRLGNAIFRYMACSVMCIKYGFKYSIKNRQQKNCSDKEFYLLISNNISIEKINSVNMIDFYQHDNIYKTYKKEIKDYIRKNPEHYILTDGINAGDGKCEMFKMIDILNTPITFTKKYKNVLHLRLEDFVTHNLYIKSKRIIDLIKNLIETNIITDELCIVCKLPITDFEINYLNEIKHFLREKKINDCIENNDTLTDYYIMKESEILICSNSTLSWCAAFFSDNIKTCYFPDYTSQNNSMTCKSPNDNTILF